MQAMLMLGRISQNGEFVYSSHGKASGDGEEEEVDRGRVGKVQQPLAFLSRR